MRTRHLSALALAITTAAMVVMTAIVFHSPRVKAQSTRGNLATKAEQGLRIAPVPLNLNGKDRNLVGLGSYLVNAVASCNDCHSAGPQTQFVPGGNPFFGQQPTRINPATYLGGGRDFGPVVPGSPDIVSRNLTPDKTGLPEGGRTYAEFLEILR